jgi:uncharacterized protein YkwD
MIKSILIFCSVFCFESSFAQNSIVNTGSNISVKDAEELLAHHNKVRKDVGTKPLVWSSKLSFYAQEWANHLATENNCKMAHRKAPGQDEKVYGENIFWGSDGKYFKTIDASVEWYNEIKLYHYTQVTEKNWEPTGHYTQMIWDNTKEVGVGVAICPNGGIIIVANYYPAGNYLRQYPY